MSRIPHVLTSLLVALAALQAAASPHLQLEPAERVRDPIVDPASDAAEKAIQQFRLSPSLQVKLWAAEPMLANPVAITFDEKGRLFVSETHRYGSSVLDIRSYMGMLEDDLASRTIEDRSAMIHRVFGEEQAKQLAIESEVVRLVEDTKGRGVADTSKVFATDFRSELDGIASGVLARRGQVWFTNIPSLWLLTEGKGEVAVKREQLLRGFGVHFNYTGHDFHGLIFGPDGKLYFTIGDRGAHVTSKEGKLIDVPDTGSCFRCNPDGTEFEVFASGLRNPQELAFDEHGNLFTGDNDCDNGDQERLVYIVEGGDSGWRIGYQHAPLGKGGPWMRDSLWKPAFPGRPAYLLPPICNIEDGPSGVAYYPGTGLTPEFANNFFICHFKGNIARSGVQSYKVKEDGATFQIVDSQQFLGGILPTDVTFGPDGRMYVCDWVAGWPKSKKGRIYAISAKNEDPAQTRIMAEMKQLLAGGIQRQDTAGLLHLLDHPDMRVRQEAQFELAARGAASIPAFESVATRADAKTLPRLHAIWGLGQLAKANPSALAKLPSLLEDADAEVRAQAAKLLGEHHVEGAYDALVAHLTDPAPRVAFFAAQSLGHLGRAEAAPALFALLRRNADRDQYLRHAAVFALSKLGATPALAEAAKDADAPVRLAALLVYRRLGDPAVAQFLHDNDAFIVREAALAINDVPIVGAFPALAARLDDAPLHDEPVVLRTINAHFRLGQPADAEALAQYAARADVPVKWRAEALHQLGAWGAPPARDRLVGVYRPLPERDAAPAGAAVSAVADALLRDGSHGVQLAALETIEQLRLTALGPKLAEVAKDPQAAAEVRARALAVLDALNDPQVNAVVASAGQAEAPAVRLAALQILARRAPTEAVSIVERLLAHGSVKEQQAAYRALGRLDTPEAAAQLAQALDRLAAGEVPVAEQVELIDSAEKSADPAVKTRYRKLRDTWAASQDTLAAWHGALEGGNPAAGSRIFKWQPVLACVRCHKIDGDGGDAGPDLTQVGARSTPEYLVESIVKPNAKIAPGFDVVTLTLKSGKSETGTLVSANDAVFVLRHPDGSQISVPADTVVKRDSAPSSMPDVFTQILTRSEIRDLVAYLETLKKPAAKVVASQPRALAALQKQSGVTPATSDAPDDNGEDPEAGQE